MPPIRDNRFYYPAVLLVDTGRMARHPVYHPVSVSTPIVWTSYPSFPVTIPQPRAERVPLLVPVGSPPIQGPYFVVWFRNLREHAPSRGVHLSDLFRPDSDGAALAGAEDIVLEGLGGDRKELKFMIHWPGYAPERSVFSTVTENGEPLTRRQLARCIMHAYAQFFAKVVRDRIVPPHAGHFDIALYQGQEARPEGVGVHLSQLHLVKLHEPLPWDDHWVAEMDVVWW